MCPTRSTVLGDALATFIENCPELTDLWAWSLQATTDTEMKAKLQSVKAVTSTLQFLFSCSLGKVILKQAINLSKTLQNPSISVTQGQEVAHMVIETL